MMMITMVLLVMLIMVLEVSIMLMMVLEVSVVLMTAGHVQTRNSPMKVDELAEKISENERC